jgi:hypothetical protein
MAAVLLITRTLRLRRLRAEAKADEARATSADPKVPSIDN